MLGASRHPDRPGLGWTHRLQVSRGRKNKFSMELGGSLRSLAWDQEAPEQLWLDSRREAARLIARDTREGYASPGLPSLPAGHPEGWADSLRDLLRPFYVAVASGLPPSAAPATAGAPSYPTLADGARAVRFVDASSRALVPTSG